MRMQSPRPTAVADIGSNTAHMLVARVNGRQMRPVLDLSSALRLGDVVTSEGAFGSRRPELLKTVRKLGGAARREGAGNLVVVGTEPFRRATDALEVAAEVGETVGERLHVLSHEEEGLLSAIGAMRLSPPLADTLIVDIGGGSTEVAFVGPRRPPTVWAAQIGSGRLTEAFLAGDPPSPAQIAALSQVVRDAIMALPAAYPETIVAVGGGARVLAKVAGSSALGAESLVAVRARLGSETARRFAQRQSIPEWRARRSLATAAILTEILRRYARPDLAVSRWGIREGLALAVANAGADWQAALPALATGVRA